MTTSHKGFMRFPACIMLTLHNKETRLVGNGGCVDLTIVIELLGHKSLQDNMGDTGLEPVTPCLSSKCSSQLS